MVGKDVPSAKINYRVPRFWPVLVESIVSDEMICGGIGEYLLDFLNVVDEGGKVRLELKDEQSAGQMRSGEEKAFRYRYVVMPMRV